MNVVAYCRLSKDDNKSRYSSIEAQQQLALDYSKKRGWVIQKFYIDDDVTGFVENEKRPEFYKMLQAIDDGNVDVVIAKDLSRFGRKNSITLSNIDLFKDLDVNLILTQDPMLGGEFDLQEDDDSLVGLSTWFNERYVKDISVKVKTGMHHQQQNGTLLQGPKFGYIKTSKKGELIVDETLRDTITTIFNLYEQGYGDRKICSELNGKYKFLTPSQVVARNLQAMGKIYLKPITTTWKMDMVKRILTNEIYTGTLITHKTESTGIHKKSAKLDVDEQYRFENHHEAIISKEQFKNVQEIRERRKESSAFYSKKSYYYIFGGFLKCGDCNGGVIGVTRVRSKREGYVPLKIYECTDKRKYGRCVSHNVREQYLLANFKQFLIEIRENYKKELKNMTLKNEKTKTKNKVVILKNELEQTKAEHKVLLAQKIKDLTDANQESKNTILDSYNELEKEKIHSIKLLEKRIQEIEDEKLEVKESNLKTAIGYFTEIINNPQPSKALLNMVLNKIYIYHDKTIEFDLKLDIQELVA